ncbi:hypothetical protein B566_EDAN011421 [Ephemera danica]|nr:hypothetical protein B566_EDAN011421 [Ephemera danica]
MREFDCAVVGHAEEIDVSGPPSAARHRQVSPAMSSYIPNSKMGGFTQRPWTPTKRRGPIAAEHSSPGPACVTLPTTIGNIDPNSKQGRAPAFSFGGRHNNKNDSPGPGPGQYNVTGLSAKGWSICV